MTQTIQAVRGMNDILPDQAPLWEFFEDTVRAWLAQYGYRNIRMPILEKTELFVRSIGEVTDIVEKEMYTFVDQLNGESLTLRPEGTASCVRAVIEHNLLYPGPQRLFYVGPMFRHERPQKGPLPAIPPGRRRSARLRRAGRRCRAHGHGREPVAAAGPGRYPARDQHAGQRRFAQPLSLPADPYLESHAGDTRRRCTRRLHTNPLRVLDSKNPAMQDVIAAGAEACR